MAHVPLPMAPRRFGETMRTDSWWIQPVIVALLLGTFLVYSTWAAFQGNNYTYGPYLSPFYSPELFGDSPHAIFGPKPGWWPSLLPFSPALLILWIPGGYRFTCYYYRGAYYKALWADPVSCAVGEPRKSYLGEHSLPLILQNVHRYFVVLAIPILMMLWFDAFNAFRFPDGAGHTQFGVGLGSLILLVNVSLLSAYSLGCHSIRHEAGGILDRLAHRPVRRMAYNCSTCFNRSHGRYAMMSLISVGMSDVFVRLCAMGIWHDWRII